jgi:hypothetical protein
MDAGSWIVVVLTLLLFAIALLTKGFTHDILLESGVFLVSVKLIVLGYKNRIASEALHRELDEIKALIRGASR